MAGLNSHNESQAQGTSYHQNIQESEFDRGGVDLTPAGMNNENGHSEHDLSSTNSNKRQFQDDFVTTLIKEAKAIGAITIDLSNKGLTSIPTGLLECQHLEVHHTCMHVPCVKQTH